MRALLVALAVLVSVPASGQGRLAFDADAVDLGRIAEGETPSHTFRFTNTGDAPLSITDVEAACGCTTPLFTVQAVPPGETGEVAVTYDSGGRPGPFEKAVYVRPEGAAPVTLRLSGVVEPALSRTGVRLGALAFDATEADVGTLPAGGDRSYQQAFRFANVGTRPVRIESVSAPDGVEVVFPDRPVFPDGIGGLYVIADDWRTSRLASGHGFETDIVLLTDDPEEPEKRLRVTGTVEVTPPRRDGSTHANE